VNSVSLVSVVLPVYNCERYISQSINSVLAQSYKNLELIIIDDCSTDNTLLICKEFVDSRVRIFTSSENSGGPARGRNLGVQLALGEYIAFIDADDIWSPIKLCSQLQILAYENTYMVSSKKIIIKNFLNEDCIFDERKQMDTTEVSYKDLLILNCIPNSSVLIRKSKIINLKFEEDKKFIGVEDHKMWLDLHKINGPSKQANTNLIGYRVDIGGISSNKFKMLVKRCYVLKSQNIKSLLLIRFVISFLFIYSYRMVSNATRL